MENFIEKLKTVDKKVWIGAGIGAAVLIISIIAFAIGSNDKPVENKGDSQKETQLGSETQEDFSETLSSEELGTEDIGTELSTEIGTEIGTEVTNEEANQNAGQSGTGQSNGGQGNSGIQSSGDGTTSTKPEDVNGVEQNTITTKPNGEEILGAGTIDEPYLEIPDLDNMTVTTVVIPAGKTLYYSISRAGGMWFSIEDADAYVIESDGKTRHDATNGKVGFVVEEAMANEYVLFQIGNKGTTAKSFTIKLANIKGSYQNPEVVTTLAAEKSLSAGDSDGYYYLYTATQTGTIRFYYSANADSFISVTRLTVPETLCVNSDENDMGGYIEIEVSKGDQLRIQIGAKPNSRWRYPATTIKWNAEFVK